MFFGLVFVVTRLFGSLVVSRYKWGFLAFSCAALFYLWYVLLGPARASASRFDRGGLDTHGTAPTVEQTRESTATHPDTSTTASQHTHTAKTRRGGRTGAVNKYGKTFLGPAAFLCFLWALYPVIFGLAEGGNVITVTSEMISYGILDLLSIGVFAYWLAYSATKVDQSRYHLSSGKASDGYVNHHGLGQGGRGLEAGHTDGMTGNTGMGGTRSGYDDTTNAPGYTNVTGHNGVKHEGNTVV
jgi:hypothetical protein